MRNPFDDLLRRKWASKQFPVHPDHRAAMEKLLEEKKRRRIIPIWWWGGGLALVGAVMLFFINPGSPVDMNSREENVTVEADEMNMDNMDPKGTSLVQPAEHREPSHGTSGFDSATTKQMSPDNRISGKHTNPLSNSTSPVKSRYVKPAAKDKALAEATDSSPVVSTHPDKPLTESNRSSTTYDQMSMPETPVESISDSQTGLTIESTDTPVDIHSGLTPSRSTSITPFLETEVSEVVISDVPLAFDIEPVSRKTGGIFLFAETTGAYLPANQPFHRGGYTLHAGLGTGVKIFPRIDILLSAGYAMQHRGSVSSDTPRRRNMASG